MYHGSIKYMNDDFDSNKPEEAVSGYPDWVNPETEDRCPECGSTKLIAYPNTDMNGRSVETIIECTDCGCTQSEK